MANAELERRPEQDGREPELPAPEEPDDGRMQEPPQSPAEDADDAPKIPSKDDGYEDARRDSAAFQDVQLQQDESAVPPVQLQQPGPKHAQLSGQATQTTSPAPSSQRPVSRPSRVQSSQQLDQHARGSTWSGAGSPGARGSHDGSGPPAMERSSTAYSTRTSTSTTTGRKPVLQGVLVVASFETILNSKDAKRIPTLKAAAQKALDILKAPGGGLGASSEDRREEVFEPLKLACETKNNTLMITALDAIGKLVSYGFFNPSLASVSEEEPTYEEARAQAAATPLPDESLTRDPKSERLSESVVDTLCSCFVESASGGAAAALQAASTTGPDVVNLQIVKALLTLVLQDGSGKGLSVHQSSLLKAVRTVYNIFLLSRSPTNQMVAQGALNQIVGSVFSRVRPDARLAASSSNKKSRPSSHISSPRPTASRNNSEFDDPAGSESRTVQELEDTVALTPTEQPNGTEGSAEVHEDTQMPFPSRRRSTDTIRASEARSQEEGESSGPETLVKGSLASATEASSHSDLPTVVEPEGSAAIPSEEAEAETAIDATGDHKAEKLTLASMASHLSLEGRDGDGMRTPAPETPTPFFSLNELHTKDAYLVFRALCKLGMKPLGVESERDMKSHAMRSKLLSLHLILSILHAHMHIFIDPNVVIYSTSTKEFIPFIQAIKQYLLLCLSRNAVSSVLSVFELSCEIFWRALSGLRTKLKKEIEVLMNEIFLPILEMRNSSVRQKLVLLNIFSRLCLDPQALVEIYINYDCDRTSLDNVYERLVNIITRVATTQFATVTPSTTGKEGKEGKDLESSAAGTASWATAMPFLPAIPATTAGAGTPNFDSSIPALAPSLILPTMTIETQLKRQSLECLVSLLRSLVAWAGRPTAASSSHLPSSSSTSNLAETGADTPQLGGQSRTSEDDLDRSFDTNNEGLNGTNGRNGSVESFDDPGRFETAKMRKTTLLEGIKKFNFKAKRGVQFLIETGFIRSKQPQDIAAFLMHADGLSKAMIGEYLGEGDPDSIATMHAFVDFMDFTNMKFVDALRMFLQSFRLPGEAQKIDRYMLKFAERYIAGNPAVFANADTAYILAFSTIMLNTDAHSPQIKKGRMTKADFFKNNRGINDGKDLPEEMLGAIYDEIQTNEIRMKDEVEAAAAGVPHTGGSGLANALSTVGRDFQREAYLLQSEGMATKTEALFKTMVRSQRKGDKQRSSEVFFSASHTEHVRPMFEVVWMPILAGVSGPLQVSEEMDLVDRSLEGFKQAIKIVCLFDLELERNAFVTTLTKFTFLNDFSEMRSKNVEAIKCMLDVAAVNGNYLKGSWKEVIMCVSQLERFQLITRGVDSRSVPEAGRKHSSSVSSRTNAAKTKAGRPTDEVANETMSSHITNAADRIFSSSSTLSGTAIVDFVRALSEVSWEEIQSSGLAEHPRVFCLTKLVEISYYNMGRIRLEWAHMWAILGEHFNQVCCHTNANVSFLALDSLRQLAMRFLEKQELANFNFQKDFLKPFEYAMVHNKNPDVRDMILQCMQQMIQARVANLRSGWRTMFGVFCAASRVTTERVANQAFDIVKRLNKENFGLIVAYGSFADLAVCITDFCKISKYQKISLHAIEMLRGLIPQMIRSPECPITDAGPPKIEEGAVDDPMTRFWFPVLFGFYDIIMNGEDLEVRKRALDYLFETLKKYGNTFPAEFWDSVCKEVLFPIFAVLRSRSDVSRFSTHEDMSVWLSTTMIQALRDLVSLFAYYFDTLVRMLDPLLHLLVECICQENDTLARIGTSCLQQLLENNVRKLTPPLWEKIVSTFVQLFQTTTAGQLFDENLRMPLDPDAPESPSESTANVNGFVHPTPLSNPAAATPDPQRASRPLGFTERRRIFRQIIVKCVLQLLLIETAHELLQNEEVYSTIPPADLLRLMAELDNSYRFAKRFNADKELRMALWKVGFMKQLPNLLKQESSSAATLVNVLLRMYSDTRPDHIAKRGETIQAFLPLGVDILEGFISLDAESQARNISAWTPVVAEVLQGICSWDDAVLQEHIAVLYPLAVDLLARDMSSEVRESVRSVFHRIGLCLSIFQAEGSVISGEDERTVEE